MNPEKQRPTVFISYSHKDEPWKDRLAAHLGVLERQQLLNFWDDRQIRAGANWLNDIRDAIAGAQVVVLLVSANSLTSSFILNEEVRSFLQRRSTDGLQIVPIIIKPCAWDAVDWLARIQVRPKDGRPLSAGSEHQIDADLTEIAKEIRELLTRQETNEQGSATVSVTNNRITVSRVPDRYEFIHNIHQGPYSRVAKCRKRDTGELCIVKDTEIGRVNVNALQVLRDLDCPNIAAPRSFWEDSGRIFEELPYIGGVRLSNAIPRSIGGLRGAVLESFCRQLEKTLNRLHEAQIVHRDIHPDNIYMVVVKNSNSPGDQDGPHMVPAWNYDGFGGYETGFLIAWVIVDCTFATLVSESSKSHYSHGPYTPEEQAVSAATAASDLYAYGATLYYGITGNDIPNFQTRRLNPRSLSSYPSGDHTARGFSKYLENLLSLEPSRRPSGGFWEVNYDTLAPNYAGTLEVSRTVLLRSWNEPAHTRLLGWKEALEIYQAQADSGRQAQQGNHRYDEWLMRDAEYWVSRLKSGEIGSVGG